MREAEDRRRLENKMNNKLITIISLSLMTLSASFYVYCEMKEGKTILQIIKQIIKTSWT